MGLDAYVYCDCYEKGRLREAPPAGVSLHVEPDGSLSGDTDELPLELQIAFDAWREQRACEHPGGVLLHHRIGNIALVALLRSELSRESDSFPTLLQKVLYNGIHASDYLPVAIFPALEQEVARLRQFRCRRSRITQIVQQHWPRFGRGRYVRLPSARADEFMHKFRMQMEQLLDAGRRVDKPISF